MNKYFLPVYHSELKPWIKWWILKRLNGGESTLKAVTISSGTLTKVDKSKALSIKEYYGNTVQNGTPTPDSPVPVQTISGDNTFTINSVNYRLDFGGKNLIDIEGNLIGTHGGITTTYNEDNSITISGTPTNTWAWVTNEVTQTLPIGQYTLSITDTLPFRIYVQFTFTDTSTQNYIINSGGKSTTFTTSKVATKYRVILSNMTSGSTYNATTKVMLASGTDTNFSPYVENPIELCKIGDYKDKIYNDNGTWKVEKNIGKVVLNGTENWIKHGSIASWFYYDGITNGYFNNAADNFALTNYFAQKSYSSVVNLTNGEFAYGSSDNGATHRLVCKDTNYTVTQDFKDWLSTHNTNVYYILATPTTETITNTNLISQLNALYEFYVNSSKVTISNNSEIPLEVLLEYYGR